MIPVNVALTTEDVEELSKKANLLGDKLRQVRAAGLNPGNPLSEVIEEIFSRKKTELYHRPLFYQLMFIAADSGADTACDTINSLIEKLNDQLEED